MHSTTQRGTRHAKRNFFRSACRVPLLISALLFAPCFTSPTDALEPNQLLLITNANVPQGRKLAEFYAEKRHVPEGRILELTLPTAEELPAEQYERDVVPVVRAYLREHKLERQVTCLVTFWGVPIRIANRVNSPKDQEELAKLEEELKALPAKVAPLVDAAEAVAHDADPAFQPQATTGNDLQSLYRRADAALAHAEAIAVKRDPPDREELEKKIDAAMTPLFGPVGSLQWRLRQQAITAQRAAASAPSTPARTAIGPATVPHVAHLSIDRPTLDRITTYERAFAAEYERPADPEARAKLRDLVRDNAGVFEYAKALRGQAAHFQTDHTNASFDNELALLWWEYPKSAWMPNPLFYGYTGSQAFPTLMVCRLDGPQSGTVSQIILTSVNAEEHGLTGRVVIDSRGLPATDKEGKPDPYGQYDQGLRNLAELVQTKTKLSLTFDDQPNVLPPNTAKDVALYMGWYSVDKYVPACQFHPGAVGFHLASYTMVTLRRPDERCWVRNLLEDGIAATLGPVAEPYLQSFPAADDLFPLILTGKVTLAEAYWRTTPWTSWMQSLIGDPLYTPYKVNPALKVEDLPPRLQKLFVRRPASAPTPP